MEVTKQVPNMKPRTVERHNGSDGYMVMRSAHGNNYFAGSFSVSLQTRGITRPGVRTKEKKRKGRNVAWMSPR